MYVKWRENKLKYTRSSARAVMVDKIPYYYVYVVLV